MAEEKEMMGKITQVEEGDKYHHSDPRDQQFVLLLRVTQANGRPLPVEGFTSRTMVQIICDVMGVIPKEVEILMDQEVVVEVEDQSFIVEVSRVIQGLFYWAGQTVTVECCGHSRLDNRDCKRMRGSEGKTKRIRARAMAIERESTRMSTADDWDPREGKWTIKKVENIHSGSMPASDGEYYTPPVSPVKINWVSKLSAPPNLPIFSGQEPVPSMEGSIDEWLFQVEGALATHTEEAVRSAVIGSVRGAACEFVRIHRLWRGDE